MTKELKIYTRLCRRCDNYFETKGRSSKICPKCTKPNHWKVKVDKTKQKHCFYCKKNISLWNKSGLCNSCYRKKRYSLGKLKK